MKITIDEDVCKKSDMTFPEVLVSILIKLDVDINSCISKLFQKQALVIVEGKMLITSKWNDIVSSILLSSDSAIPNDGEIESLAIALTELFPKGKKEGTNIYWRGNLKDTKLRLKKFFKLYGNKYSNDQIERATRKYVESFNGDYSYMRVLKYFIWKNNKKQDSEGNTYIEEVSDLATFIENAGQEDVLGNDWNTELV